MEEGKLCLHFRRVEEGIQCLASSRSQLPQKKYATAFSPWAKRFCRVVCAVELWRAGMWAGAYYDVMYSMYTELPPKIVTSHTPKIYFWASKNDSDKRGHRQMQHFQRDDFFLPIRRRAFSGPVFVITQALPPPRHSNAHGKHPTWYRCRLRASRSEPQRERSVGSMVGSPFRKRTK